MSAESAPPVPEKYLEGIRLFNAGDYYDAHEAWEEHWQNMGDSSAIENLLPTTPIDLVGKRSLGERFSTGGVLPLARARIRACGKQGG